MERKNPKAAASALRNVKIVHTVAWAFFAGCIALIPFMAWRRQFTVGDIYLPLWIATYDKQIFGTLFVAGIFYTLVQWMRA
jgi:hypothetical protein